MDTNENILTTVVTSSKVQLCDNSIWTEHGVVKDAVKSLPKKRIKEITDAQRSV